MGRNSTYKGLAKAIFQQVVALTAAYQCVPEDIGVLFTNRGAAGSVTITLPPTSELPVGWFCEFFQVADEIIIVASPTADTMVVFNDAAADSVSYATAAEMIGNGLKFTWDGTGWLVRTNLAADSVTATIVTA